MVTKSAPLFFDLPEDEIPNDSVRTFDESCEGWHFDMTFNRAFLRAQQNWANDVLRSRGHLLLNDVYDALGFPRTKLGAVAGWTVPNTVDFGVVNQARAFDLHFNIQGVILDQI